VTAASLPYALTSGSHSRWRPLLAIAIAAGIAMVFWQALTVISGGWVPSLDRIGNAIVRNVTTPALYGDMLITSRRILIAFVASSVVGVALGFAMGLNRRVEAFLRPLVVISLSIPDPVYIIVAILALGTDESSGIIALTLDLIPFVVVIVHGAVKARESQLDEMSRVYRFGQRQYLTQVLARQVAPALFVAARTSFVFAWKIVVLVEALSQPQGIGAEIYLSFRLLRPADMIAQALIFILLMKLVEVVTFGLAERRLFAWMR
jgi:ABC-type nitrate/sulfonate/bicarbonate transport system permease component